MNALDLANVTKVFGVTPVVDNLSLAIPEGTVYGFIGPNGSGKTTTLRMIVNIIQPDQGTIKVFGHTFTKGSPPQIGYLPEERGVYRRMKVRNLLEFYGRLRCGQSVSAEVETWLDKFELTPVASQRVETLSKGMSQKVQFIAAIVPLPKLLILDEPFSGLDPVNADLIRAVLLEICRRGTTVIFSTHDMNVAESICDRLFMIFRGRKVLDGTLADIRQQYGTDTIRVETEGGVRTLRELAGVESIRDFGQFQELRISPSSDPQQLLSTLVSRTRVTHFSVITPSLHDIFVRIATPESEELSLV